MGLDKAKSLLKVKDDNNFLDLTAKQIMKMREKYGFKVKFMLIHSFSTSVDTMDFFKKNYPAFAAEKGLEMLQNKVPKTDIQTLTVCIEKRCVKPLSDSNLSLTSQHNYQKLSPCPTYPAVCG